MVMLAPHCNTLSPQNPNRNAMGLAWMSFTQSKYVVLNLVRGETNPRQFIQEHTTFIPKRSSCGSVICTPSSYDTQDVLNHWTWFCFFCCCCCCCCSCSCFRSCSCCCCCCCCRGCWLLVVGCWLLIVDCCWWWWWWLLLLWLLW